MVNNRQQIEILDTTLREGEQTDGVAFTPQEKLLISNFLLRDLAVDRVEIGSCRVSSGEFEAVSRISRSAGELGLLDRVEVLGFVDGRDSVDWIKSAGAKVLNLLCKGSERHCSGQLQRTPAQHIDDIRQVIDYADRSGIAVNIYLEDWSGGMTDDPEYALNMVDVLRNAPVRRFMLTDTLGILEPEQTLRYISIMRESFPDIHFDFHAHNDYDLAVANSFSAVSAGVNGLHTTINGLGERAGNAPLASIQAILRDHFGAVTSIDESRLYEASRLVESYSGVPVPVNQPVVGEKVFTQVAGIHADGDTKGELYCGNLKPERFGRRRSYALGKTSGRANIRKNLEELGIKLDEKTMELVTKRVIELGDKKEWVMPEDLPYIAADVLKNGSDDDVVKLKGYVLNVALGLKPMASICVEVRGETYEASSSGSGQYDAFVKALRKIWHEKLGREFPILDNYVVTIPPGGRTDALVQTVISWKWNGRTLRTCGLDADQTEAAMKATVKMLNIFEQDQ